MLFAARVIHVRKVPSPNCECSATKIAQAGNQKWMVWSLDRDDDSPLPKNGLIFQASIP